MDHIEENSCVRFLPRTDQHDYVDIIPGNGGCYAYSPYWDGGGRREIGLEQSWCVSQYVVVHELLHTLGVRHEQQRPDRDDYVTVHWDNIQVDFASNYFIETWVDTTPIYTEICNEDGKPDGEIMV